MMHRVGYLAVVVGAVASLLPLSAQAQFGVRTEGNDIFLPAPRELRRQVAQAAEMIEEENFSDAAEALGMILADKSTEDYFIDAPGDEQAKTSLKAEAQRLLGTMPPRGRRQYEDRFGAEARRMYDDAVVSGDLRALADITRMYFHTEAGHAATMLLGRYRLDEGRPLAAAMCFQRLADSSAANRFEPQLSILLAHCWQLTGRTEEARSVLLNLKKRTPGVRLRVGEREVRLFDDDRQALAWLSKTLPSVIEGRQAEASQWLVHRGNASRNASSKGGMPIQSLTWAVPTIIEKTEEDQAVKLYTQYRDRDVPVLPAFQPLAVQNLVLMRTPRRMMAVDFVTGKRIWEYPWYESQLDAAGGSPRGGSASLDEKLNQRLFEDAVYGQMASDGRSVYVLDKVGYARANRTSGRVILMPGGNVRQPSDLDTNELVALDLKSQGKLRWIVGGQSGGDEEKLAGAFFLGPPLPVLGQLYALAEFNGEIRLVVLDARTGELDWAQQLALLDNRTIVNDPMRRLAGATPSFSDGVLVCPTSAGAVVAVDVANRSLLWGYQYQQQTLQSRFRRRIPTTRQRNVGERWADATATIDAGRVLLTPVESDEMLCLDLFTGRSLWENNLPRGDRLFVAGIYNDRAIVVGKESVSAINLVNPETEEWVTPLEGAPSGRGFVSDGHYFQPTTESLLYKIDLRDGGTPLEPVETDGVLGNLVCYKDEIISQGFSPGSDDKDDKFSPRLSVHAQEGALRSKVREALRNNPNDSWGLARQGELRQSDGDLSGAIASFRRAHTQSDSEEHLGLLVRALIAAIEEDFANHQELVEEAERLTRQTSWRADYLRVAAAGRQQTGELEQALENYLQLVSLASVRPHEDSPAGVLKYPEDGWQVRRPRWIRARLQELLRSSRSQDADQRRRVDRQIAAQFEAAMSAANTDALRKFVDYFSMHPLADEARLALAQRLIDSEQRLEAELLLAGLAHRGAEHAAAAQAMYCRLLERMGPTWEAAVAYRQLARDYQDVVCLAGRTGAELAAAVDPSSPLGQALATPADWNRGETEVSQSVYETRNAGVYQRIYPVQVPQWDLAGRERMHVRIDQSQQEIVLCRSSGAELARISSAREDKVHAFPNYSLVHAKGVGHLLIFSLGFEIVAVDVAEAQNDPAGAVLWRFDLAPVTSGRSGIPLINATSKINPWGEPYYVPTDPLQRPFGQIASLSDAGVCFQYGQRLVCLDPLTGQEIWSRGGVPEGCDVFGDEQFVFAIPPSESTAMVYSTSDGGLVGRRPLKDDQQRWVTRGSNLLTWSEMRGSLMLELVDLFSGDVLFSRSYSEGTKASIVDHAEVAVYEKSGKFAVYSLDDGKEKLSITLDDEPQLSSIYVQKRNRQYLLITNRPITSPLPDTNVQAAPGGYYAPLVHGNLYALDAVSGKPKWTSPVKIEQQGFPLDQPTDTPLLIFLRHLNSTSGSARPTRTSLQCIDVRDGSEIFRDEFVATTSSYQIVGDLEHQTVKLNLPARNYTIRFREKRAAAPASAGG